MSTEQKLDRAEDDDKSLPQRLLEALIAGIHKVKQVIR